MTQILSAHTRILCDLYICLSLIPILYQVRVYSLSSTRQVHDIKIKQPSRSSENVRTIADSVVSPIYFTTQRPYNGELEDRRQKRESESDSASSNISNEHDGQETDLEDEPSANVTDDIEKLVRSQVELAALHWSKPNASYNMAEYEDPSMVVATYVSNLTALSNTDTQRRPDGYHLNHNYEPESDASEASTESWPSASMRLDPMATSSDGSKEYGTVQYSNEDISPDLLVQTTPMEPTIKPNLYFQRPKYMYRVRGPVSRRDPATKSPPSPRPRTLAPAIVRTMNRLDQIHSPPQVHSSEYELKRLASEPSPKRLVDPPRVRATPLTSQNRKQASKTTLKSAETSQTTTSVSPTSATTASSPTRPPRPKKLPASYKLSQTRIGNKVGRNLTSLLGSVSSTSKKPSHQDSSQTEREPMTLTVVNKSQSKQPATSTSMEAHSARLSTTPMTSPMLSSWPKQTTPIQFPLTSSSFATASFLPSTLTSTPYATSPTVSPTTLATLMPHPVANSSLNELFINLKPASHHHIHSHIHRIKPTLIGLPYLTMTQPRPSSYDSIMAAAAAAAAAAASVTANRPKLANNLQTSASDRVATSAIGRPFRRVIIRALPIGVKVAKSKSHQVTRGKTRYRFGSAQSKLSNKIRQLSTDRTAQQVAVKPTRAQLRRHLIKRPIVQQHASDARGVLQLEPSSSNEMGSIYGLNEVSDDNMQPPAFWPSQLESPTNSALKDYLTSLMDNPKPQMELSQANYMPSTLEKVNQKPELGSILLANDNDYIYNPPQDPPNVLYSFDGDSLNPLKKQTDNHYELSQLLNMNDYQASNSITTHDESGKDISPNYAIGHLFPSDADKANGSLRNNSESGEQVASSNQTQIGLGNPMHYALAHYIDDQADYIGGSSGFKTEQKSKPLLEIYDDSEARFSSPHVHHTDLMTTHNYEGFKPIVSGTQPNNTFFFDYPVQSHQHYSGEMRLNELGPSIGLDSQPKRVVRPINSPSQIHVRVRHPSLKEIQAYGHVVPKGHAFQQVVYPTEILQHSVAAAKGSLKPHLDSISSIINDQKQQLLEGGKLLLNPEGDLAVLSSAKHSKAHGHSHKHIIHGLVPLALIATPLIIMIAVLAQIAILIPIMVTVINLFIIPIIINVMRPARNREDVNHELKKLLYWPFPGPEARKSNETSTACIRRKRAAIDLETSRNLPDLDEFFESLISRIDFHSEL